MVDKQKIVRSFLALCFSVQVTVLMAQALSALNTPSNAYDAILYVVFIASSVLVYLLIQDQKPAWYVGLEAVVTFLLVSAVFKATIYDNSPWLASKATLSLLGLAIILKLFWQEMPKLKTHVLKAYVALSPWQTWIACVLIAAFVYVPNLKAVLAEIFIGEQAHHLDFFLMAPGVSSVYGGLPYVDVISQYGVGIPVLLSKLCVLFGGFDYLPFLRMNVAFGILYFILFYCFTRVWLGSAILAFAAFLVVFRLQMFHYGVSPLCWIYPSSTPIRFGLDIVWLWFLWRHLQTGRILFLILAAAYSGFAVYYMTSSGICIIMTLYFYMAGAFLLGHLKKQHLWVAILPLVVAFIFFWMTLGAHVFSSLFWKNCIEYMSYFATGRGALPMFESLKYRNFWVGLIALAMPLLYVATVLTLSILMWHKKIDRKYFLCVVIAVYGLVNYQYFVVRSAMTSYYLSAVPFVLICAFWVHIILKQLKSADVKKVQWACLILALYALVTNHNYISYPNVFNFSANPMTDIKVAQRFPDRQGYFHHLVKHIKEEDKVLLNAAGDQDEHLATEDSFKNDQQLIRFIEQESDFTKDAKLITDLIGSNERVALLSSFETKILIQAKRAPFFYHTPLVTSQPMRVRYFPADAAHSPSFLKDTIAQLADQRPTYVFIENVFLQDVYPASYKESNANILTIVSYIRQNYAPYAQGQYLTAMKRKD